MNQNSVLVTAPSSEPVTTSELKDHLRLTTTADDAYIDTLISAARSLVEKEIGRVFITQTWALFLDHAPRRDMTGWWDGVREGAITMEQAQDIELPVSPLISVSHIKSYDNSDVGTTFASSNYFVDVNRTPGRVSLRSGSVWPSPSRLTAGIEIEYDAGYGDASAVPSDIKHLIKVIAADWYENRETAVVGTITSRSYSLFWPIIEKYRIVKL